MVFGSQLRPKRLQAALSSIPIASVRLHESVARLPPETLSPIVSAIDGTVSVDAGCPRRPSPHDVTTRRSIRAGSPHAASGLVAVPDDRAACTLASCALASELAGADTEHERAKG